MDKENITAFWSKVDISDDANKCWEWRGAKKPSGYGNVRINGVYKSAHRTAFELSACEIPSGLIVMHLCDNRACCNPRHLVLGTYASNYCDMLIKNRHDYFKNKASGAKNHKSKFTDDDILDIRSQYPGKNQYEIARIYGVSQACISSILRRETWRHV